MYKEMTSTLDIENQKWSTHYIDPNGVTNLLHSQILENNLINNQNILEHIQHEYLSENETFDASRHELFKVPKLLNSKDIIIHYKELLQQHQAISKSLLFLILQKQSTCKAEFENILIMQQYLRDIVGLCKLCRNDLNLATHQFTFSSLQILHYFRKRKILESLLNTLQSIKTLYRTKDRLSQFFNQENYPKVISLISECQRASETYKQYTSIVGLCHDLKDTLEQVEENLDCSLSKNCIEFDVHNYASVQVAYKFLGKSEIAVDQLHMHFTAAVHNVAFDCLRKYSKDNADKQYNDLCKSVSLSNFFPCLIHLCRSLLVIIKSYYLIIKWHKNHNNITIEDEKVYNKCTNQYVLQKLENGIIKICNDIENKLIIYIKEFDLILLKFEEFIQVLKTVDRISNIGKKICKKEMTKLYECTKMKFANYISHYHISRLDELRIFLENDGWNLCPIKSTFKITQLLEFRTLKCIFNTSLVDKNVIENLSEMELSGNNDLTQECLDDLILSFDSILDESTEEDILRSSEDNQLKESSEDSVDDDDDGISEELKYNYIDKKYEELIFRQKKSTHAGAIITNTSLSLLRTCGKYLQITRFIQEISETILQYIIHLFELYFYAVYSFFASDLINSDFGTVYGNNLKRTISRIKDTLIVDNNDKLEISNVHYKVSQPHLSSVINLNDPKELFGLKERVVAVESLIFLGHQYESFRSYFSSTIMDENELTFLNQFYLQTVASTIALRKPIYMATISKAFDTTKILVLMNKVDWELKDVVSQHSDYIDFLIEELQEFKLKLTEIQNIVPLSKTVCESIWECVAHLIASTFVEGFSNVKKCSNGGRALMQLDFTQFISKFQTITLLRPMPHQEYVTTYIKAYYLPESSMESWLKTHPEYSLKQLSGLLSCMYQNKKVKQKFLNLIEDQRLT